LFHFLFFKGFPQPKAIRDNSGYFRQEIYYPGSGTSENILVQQQPQQQPLAIPNLILQSTVQPNPVTVRTVQNRQRFAGIPTIPISTTSSSTLLPTTTESLTEEELEQQAKSAFYEFGTSVHDTINDHEHIRQEVREGLALTGMY
jgi:hypothetical protein